MIQSIDMAYGKKFRESVLRHMAKGNSQEATAKLFGVGTTTIKAWRKLLAATGSLEQFNFFQVERL